MAIPYDPKSHFSSGAPNYISVAAIANY